MAVSEDLVILASELVKLAQKWDEGSDTAEKLGDKSQWKIESPIKSRERQVNYLDGYKKSKANLKLYLPSSTARILEALMKYMACMS